jgi:hypothetical protein
MYRHVMPISLPEIVELVKKIGWKHEVQADGNFVLLGFSLKHHVDLDGDKHVMIGIECHNDGVYVQVAAQRVYNLANCKYKGATLAALAELAFRTRSLQCEYDPSDGEVRYSVDTWVLDNTLTANQLEMMVRILVDLLEEYEPVIRTAMDTGKVDFELANKRTEPTDDSNAPAPLPPEIAELLARAGGVEGLREALELAEQAKKKG